MASFWSRIFGTDDAGPRARQLAPTVEPDVALAQHPVVNLQAQGHSPVLDLPIWVKVPPESAEPRTYEHLFWDVRPVGEYLYYLAGDFARNDKGFLRYGSAPLETRVERTFEVDVLERGRSELPGREGRDWRSLFQGETCASLADRLAGATDGDDDGTQGWTLAHVSGLEIESGVAVMQVEPGMGVDGAPRVTLLFRKIVPEGPEVPVAYGIGVRCISRQGDQPVLPMMDAFRDLVGCYRDMPYVAVSGALRV